MKKLCHECVKELDDLLPFKCKHCGEFFCKDHYLPENHKCPDFKPKSWIKPVIEQESEPIPDFKPLPELEKEIDEPYHTKVEGGKKKLSKKQPNKIINSKTLIYRIVGVFLIILLLFTLYSLYNTTVETIDSYSDLSAINSNLQDTKDELNSLNNQISSAENQLSDVYAEVLLLQSGNRYELHDPTYSEVISFISTDATNSNNYGSGYTCVFFSMDVNNNAEQQGIRCAYVELDFVDSGHAIVAFETTDEGLVYFEPQHDVRANIEIGSRFYSCLAQLPGYLPWEAPDYDDTIESIVRFW